jgi:hypothetical protein
MRAVPLRVVESNTLLVVRSRWHQLSKPEEGRPEGHVGLEEELWVLCALGKVQTLLRSLTRHM